MKLALEDKLCEAKLRLLTLINGYLSIGLAIGVVYCIYTIGKVIF